MEEDNDELANSKTNERIEWLPEHLNTSGSTCSIIFVNTFVCMQAQ